LLVANSVAMSTSSRMMSSPTALYITVSSPSVKNGSARRSPDARAQRQQQRVDGLDDRLEERVTQDDEGAVHGLGGL
jgi:hypothetical protein